MTNVSIQIQGDRVIVATPYNPRFPAAARNLGGRWEAAQLRWTFDIRDEQAVRNLLLSIYGTDGTPTPTVTARRSWQSGESLPGEIWIAGRLVLSRPERDGSVRLGQGVVLVSGGFRTSGGSARYPQIGPLPQDVTIEIRDIPASLAADDDELVIIDNQADRRAAIENQIARLQAEIDSLQAQLSSL
jgi:hypothetical protein